MTEMLSPEEARFLKNDTSKVATEGRAAQSRASKSPVVSASERSQSTSLATTRRKPALSGTINNKIDERVSNALLRASTERRIRQEEPHLQRDILAEALTEWLVSRGYEIEGQ
jgi:hypothetical protein